MSKLSYPTVHPVKRGDTARKFQDHLQVDGDSVDLTGASVKFVLRTKAGVVLVNRAGSVLQVGTEQDKTEPNVECQVEVGDLEELGTHEQEWHVRMSGGGVLTLPQEGYNLVRVWDTLTPIGSSSSSGP